MCLAQCLHRPKASLPRQQVLPELGLAVAALAAAGFIRRAIRRVRVDG